MLFTHLKKRKTTNTFLKEFNKKNNEKNTWKIALLLPYFLQNLVEIVYWMGGIH